MLTQSESVPMTFPVRLVFQGQMRRESLEAAVVETVASHPLLTSFVKNADEDGSVFEAPPSDLRWVPSGLPPVVSLLSLDDSAIPTGLTSQSDRIDLTRENGFKTFIAEHGGKTEVHFLFHHACCDGLGAFEFVEEVLANYHRVETGEDVRSRQTDLEALKLRDPDCETLLPWHRRMIRSGFVLPRRIAGMVRGPLPDEIATRQRVPSSLDDQPVSAVFEMPTLTLDSTQTSAISQIATKHQCSMNELLLSQLFDVLLDWNREFSVGYQPGLLRAIIPFTLRNDTHKAMPAANCVSMVYVDAPDSTTLSDSLSAVAKQFKYIRRWQIEYSWNRMASFAFRSNSIAALLKKQANRRLCTTVFSNLGRPFKHSDLPRQENGRINVGGLELESAHLAAPVTETTVAVFAALFYAGGLTLTMNYSKARMSRSDAQELMQRWSQRLVSLIK